MLEMCACEMCVCVCVCGAQVHAGIVVPMNAHQLSNLLPYV